jgi:hypothetical protein
MMSFIIEVLNIAIIFILVRKSSRTDDNKVSQHRDISESCINTTKELIHLYY